MSDIGIDLARIRALADAFDASDWDEVDLVVDGVHIRLSAVAGDAAGTGPPPAPNPPAAALATDPVAVGEVTHPGPAGEVAEVPAEIPADASGRGVPAPSPGIFWRAPSPGAPPFVGVGDRVEPDTVVGIVELMKLMNRVAAGVAGTVTAVPVDNGQTVEKAQSLVLVEPDPV